MILATVLGGIFLLSIEGRKLIKESQWKELLVITCIVCIAIILIVFESFGYKSPFQIIEAWVSPIGKYIFK